MIDLYIALGILKKIQCAENLAFLIIMQKLLVLGVSYMLLYIKRTPKPKPKKPTSKPTFETPKLQLICVSILKRILFPSNFLSF